MQQFLLVPIEEGTLTPENRMLLFDRFGTFTKTVVTMFELTTSNRPM